MSIIDYLFPKQCLLCSRIGYDICPKCIVKISHSLPSCCICNNLNNDYHTHTYCSTTDIQCFTGWYLTKEVKQKIERKKQLQIYSVHRYLLGLLINYLNINNIITNSKILPLPTDDFKTERLNRYLARCIRGNNSNNLLYIGESTKDIDVLRKKKRLLLQKPQHLQVLVLFTQIGPPHREGEE